MIHFQKCIQNRYCEIGNNVHNVNQNNNLRTMVLEHYRRLMKTEKMRLCLNTQVNEPEAVRLCLCELWKPTSVSPPPAETERCSRCDEMWGNCRDHLFDIAACLGTGLDEHDVQLFGSLLSFLNCDLPAGKKSHFTGAALTHMALTCCRCLVHNI